MSLECIYVVRHGFRGSWTVDPRTGVYSTTLPTPTGIAADPALTSHGTRQAEELGHHLMSLDPPIDAVYSSPYYRCLQTITPFVELRRRQTASPEAPSCDSATSTAASIRTEHGLGEWYGLAPFDHPRPAPVNVLREKFPAICEDYTSATHSPIKGETLTQLYERVATSVRAIIERCDNEGKKAVVLCTHAAVVITLGRVLTGCIPDDPSVEDFGAFTCGLSVFRRQLAATGGRQQQRQDQVQYRQANLPGGEGEGSHTPEPTPAIFDGDKEITNPLEVVPPWRCELNSDCSFLTSGAERGWMFFGDESFLELGPMSQTASFGTKL